MVLPSHTGFSIIINALGGQCERGSRINIDALYLKNGYMADANLTVGYLNFLEHSRLANAYLSFGNASIGPRCICL